MIRNPGNFDNLLEYLRQNRSKAVITTMCIVLGLIALILIFVGASKNDFTLKGIGGAIFLIDIVFSLVVSIYYCHCRHEYPAFYDGSCCDNCFGGNNNYIIVNEEDFEETDIIDV